MKTMENKVVFITGGTSGYGEAMARLFTQEGAKVIIAARKENELAEKSKEIGCDALKMDVTDFDAWGKAKAYILEKEILFQNNNYECNEQLPFFFH